jgi:signal transduction histidine kinase
VRRPRGIFVKLVAVFLLVGLLPFLLMAGFAYWQAKTHMTEAVVESWLVRLARETAAHIDRSLAALRASVMLWSEEEALAADAVQAARGTPGAAARLTAALDRRAVRIGDVAVAMVVARDGRILAAAGSDRSRAPSGLVGRNISEVAPDASAREWIAWALVREDGRLQQVDWHRSPFAPRPDSRGAAGAPRPQENPDAHHVGYAVRLRDLDPRREPVVLAVLFRFTAIQQVLDEVQLKFTDEQGRGGRAARYPSGYAFLFGPDGDTVIGHKARELYGTSLTRDHKLPQLHEAILANDFGSVYYDYPPGVPKISGFAHTASIPGGGFGWTVGVGINGSDIYGDVLALRDLLAVATLIVAGFVVLMAALLSARITRPLTRLVGFTESVARGNLDARVSIKSGDEIAVLAEAFNRMTDDLKETNRRLIQAEKDAAWREMARQVAHEIKNPLTPIMLSAQQIEKAAADRHPEIQAIVRDAVQSIVEQCESLREIAQNFASYAAFPKPKLARITIEDLVDKVVGVFAAHQREGFRIDSVVDIAGKWAVRADADAMRRVFLNLFNNAYEAMSGKGTITVRATVEQVPSGAVARISVADTGRGIAPDDLSRLFEPYFSTRSGGTGLGLAICRKIVSEHEGSITVESEQGKGTTFTISIPCFPADAPFTAEDDASFSETRTLPRGT